MAKLSYVRGTTFNITFNYTPPTGGANGATALFTVKTEIDNDPTDTDNAVVAPKNITMTDNSCVISLAPGDVADTISAANNYVWDIRVIDTSGNIYPGDSGAFELDVTATNRITG